MPKKAIRLLDLASVCDEILKYHQPLALRLKAALMMGAARVYHQQIIYFYCDIKGLAHSIAISKAKEQQSAATQNRTSLYPVTEEIMGRTSEAVLLPEPAIEIPTIATLGFPFTRIAEQLPLDRGNILMTPVMQEVSRQPPFNATSMNADTLWSSLSVSSDNFGAGFDIQTSEALQPQLELFERQVPAPNAIEPSPKVRLSIIDGQAAYTQSKYISMLKETAHKIKSTHFQRLQKLAKAFYHANINDIIQQIVNKNPNVQTAAVSSTNANLSACLAAGIEAARRNSSEGSLSTPGSLFGDALGVGGGFGDALAYDQASSSPSSASTMRSVTQHIRRSTPELPIEKWEERRLLQISNLDLNVQYTFGDCFQKSASLSRAKICDAFVEILAKASLGLLKVQQSDAFAEIVFWRKI